jgi:hypothetical protein
MAKLNLFEGGRRITRVLQASVIILCAAVAFFWRPYPHLTVETARPGAAWFIAADDCHIGIDGTEWLDDYDLGNGVRGTVLLCFRAMTGSGGRKFVPVRQTGSGSWHGSHPFSPDVADYTRARGARFVPRPEMRETLREEFNRQWWKDHGLLWGVSLVVAVVLCALLAVESWAVGWVVRGFAGIPSGHDHRPVARE